MEESKVVHFDFIAKERSDEPIEALQSRPKGKIALRSLRRRSKPELVPEATPPTVDEVLLLAFQSYTARCNLGTERQTIDKPEIDLIEDTFRDLFRNLSQEQQIQVRDKVGEYTGRSAVTGKGGE